MEAVYSEPGTRVPWIEGVARQFVLLALSGIVLRYLYPVSPPWATGAVYLAGWVTILGLARYSARLRSLALLGVTLGAPAVVYLLARVAMHLGIVPIGTALEERLLLIGYALAPAATLGTILWQWELWCRRSARGRVLFAPLVALLSVGLFWSQADLRRGILGHPTVYAIFAMFLLAALALHGMVRTPLARRRETVIGAGVPGNRGEIRISRRGALAAIVLLVLSAGVLTLLYRAWQREAVSASGGLMRPTAFRFDFADYLSLETEIGLSRDLVLLYREDRMPPGRLIRRYVLSAYSPRRGFYRLDEAEEPSRVPPLGIHSFARSGFGADPLFGAREAVDQEYYIVNFDPDAFMAIPEPRTTEQLQVWDRSSFNSAYRVESLAPVSFIDMILEESEWPSDLDEDWREVYVGDGVPAGVAELAREITADVDGYYRTVAALRDYLQENYYYSLVPGVAADGDQLGHFLFDSRKGYCSYFAFSMALMARSLGIPARVAVGFFVDPDTGMLGFYPVRGDMAHAWVEIWFDEQGWIAFDPTSQTVAPGEVVSTDYGIDQERLSSLIEEILSQGELATREPERTDPTMRDRIGTIARRAARRWYLLLPVLVVGWYVGRRGRWRRLVRKSPHRAALLLFARSRELLAPEAREVPYLRTGGALAAAGELAAALRYDRPYRTDAPAAMRELCDAAVRTVAAERGGTRGVFLRLRAAVPPRVGYRRGSGAAAAFLVMALSMTPPLQADPKGLEDEIYDALDAENYEEAIRRITGAQEEYPGDPRFSLIEGDLYFDQGLYNLAEEAYREAIALGADLQSTSHSLAETLARGNRDEEAIRILEQMLVREPGRRDVVADVAWLYFKTHRLERARRLLEDAIAEDGAGADLSMTLATVYSGLWNYEAARREYERAIRLAEEQDNRLFLAVAYYNQSILHAKFYHWEEALAAAERSLEYSERSSGYLIRGEYQEQRLLWESAARDYEQAHATDSITPLPALSLAVLWTEAGDPDRAIAQLREILEEENRNWIYNYGTDPVRFDAQVHGAIADAYEAAAHRDWLYRPGGMGERLRRRARSVYRRALAWYHRGLYSRLTARIADAYAREGQDLMEEWNRMLAAESWSRTAARHAEAARAIETALNPAAEEDYRLILADLEGNQNELAALRGELTDPWQRPLLMESLVLSMDLDPRLREALAPRLYAIAPGSFLVNGFSIPVTLDAQGLPISDGSLRRRLRRLGFSLREEAPLVLRLRAGADGLEYVMIDRELTEPLRRGTVRGGAESLDAAIVELAETLTRVVGLGGD